MKSTLIMKENLELMNERGIKVPVVLGGAALTRRYVEEDLKSLYQRTNCTTRAMRLPVFTRWTSWWAGTDKRTRRRERRGRRGDARSGEDVEDLDW